MENVLASQKIYFKAVEREDLDKRVEWINDPEIQKTLNYKTPVSRGGMLKWYDKISSDLNRWDFSVFSVEENKYIGFCGFINYEPTVKKAEMYAVLGDKQYWKGGYGTDIYRVLMKFGFIEIGLNKIYGFQLVHNLAAHRVVEKLGWERDGLLRDDIYSHGELKSRFIVSILKSDWDPAK